MSDESSRTKAAPGWYPHPSMAHTNRYWDGEEWTDNIAPAPPMPVAPIAHSGPGVMTIARGVALGLVVVIAAIWFIGGMVTADNEADCRIDNMDRAIEGQPMRDCD